MWEYEHRVETTADPEVLWRIWSDMADWPSWNAGIKAIEVDGPFTVGSTFRMTSPDGDTVELRLAEIVPGEAFVDEMDAGDFVVRTVHRLERGSGATRVVYRTEFHGPAADEIGPKLGPAITADFPDVLAALVRKAER